MAKIKNKPSTKPEKYVSPWATTKKNVAHYRQSFYRPGGQPPIDFSKLETRVARRPGQGSAWRNSSEILNEKKELKSNE